MFGKAFSLLLILTSLLMASNIHQTDDSKGTKTELAKKEMCKKVLASNAFIDDPEKRGCCSHHGGVCGCSEGRAQCCDGSLSPSCGCD